MTCCDDGRLMAYLDGGLAVEEREEVARHLEGCAACRERAGRLGADRSATGAALALTAALPLTATQAVTTFDPLAPAAPAPWQRYRRTVAAAAVAAACGVAFSFPSVRAAAADFLNIFRVEQVQVITVRPEEMAQMAAALQQGVGQVDMKQFGQAAFDGGRLTGPLEAAEAARRSGVDLPALAAAPEGYGQPSYYVKPESTARFTFNAKNINSLLQSLGGSQVLPDSVDGQSVRVRVPATAVVRYPASAAGQPSLHLMRLTAPELQVPEGTDIQVVRTALLAIPILPADLRAQLVAVRDWQHTLILPAMEGQSSQVSVNGKPVIYLEGPGGAGYGGPGGPGGRHRHSGGPGHAPAADGAAGAVAPATSGGALVWVDGGTITILGGAPDRARAVALAEGLR